MKKYAVKEIFLTLQGEGFHSGSAAVFVRLAGCNAWSGRPEDRERDSKKATCALWCDTDFIGGTFMSAEDISQEVCRLWLPECPVRVVVTGGEPSLQMDDNLVRELKGIGSLAVETNGSRRLPDGIDWVCLSPKPPLPVASQRYDEVKVVFPAVDPAPWRSRAGHLFIQPQDGVPGSVEASVRFVQENPEWRLSLQTHKLLGIP